MRFFHRTPPLRDAITDSLRELQAEKNRLQMISARIQQRDRLLFNLCVTATRNRNTEKATIFANELSELRKTSEMVGKSQLAVEQFTLRLETIRELGDVLSQLKPAISIMSDIKNQIAGIMPEVAEKIGSVNNELGNAIAMMTPPTDLSETRINFLTSSELAEKVIDDATHIVEERIKEELPDVPRVPSRAQTPTERPMPETNLGEIALAIGGEEMETQIVSADIKMESHAKIEPILINTVQPKKKDVKEQILSYAKKNNGEINVSKCAKELNIKSSDVFETLDILCKENKIKY